jgi:hypothetical protein
VDVPVAKLLPDERLIAPEHQDIEIPVLTALAVQEQLIAHPPASHHGAAHVANSAAGTAEQLGLPRSPWRSKASMAERTASTTVACGDPAVGWGRSEPVDGHVPWSFLRPRTVGVDEMQTWTRPA